MRWSEQIKQTLQLADFLGHNANAVRWQVWMALLVYVLLRYLSYLSRWTHSFTRLLTVVRSVLWEKRDLLQLLDRYGTIFFIKSAAAPKGMPSQQLGVPPVFLPQAE